MKVDSMKLVRTNEGISSLSSLMEVPFMDAKFISAIELYEYQYTESVTNYFYANESLYNIGNPILNKLYMDNVFTGLDGYSYYKIVYWEFGFSNERYYVKAAPYSLFEAFSDIGGQASFLGVIAILVGMINEKQFMRELRESITEKRKKGFCNKFKSTFRPDDEEKKVEEDIANCISFKELYYTTKVLNKLKS
mmetsp:Transcript_11700/g.11618  ORF Transcript_11700/g.11618 Transcript_11700/m.11618 type:complete len:193 (+) Transcript_11700:472-1050(+)